MKFPKIDFIPLPPSIYSRNFFKLFSSLCKNQSQMLQKKKVAIFKSSHAKIKPLYVKVRRCVRRQVYPGDGDIFSEKERFIYLGGASLETEKSPPRNITDTWSPMVFLCLLSIHLYFYQGDSSAENSLWNSIQLNQRE